MHKSVLLAITAAALLAPASAEELDRVAPELAAPRIGDLPEMEERRVIRVLVTPNKTEYFVIKGQERGFEFELMEQYEAFINKGTRRDELRVNMVYIPTPFDELLSNLAQGRGDIAAAGLTITAQRKTKVDFTIPYVPNVSEVVVSHKSVKDLHSVDELSGRTLYVLRGSSYVQHLNRLNEYLKKQGRVPVNVVEADAYLASEDIFELVNAGIVKLTISDHHIAKLWSNVLPNMVVREDLAINKAGQIAWAVRRNNPELLASLNGFMKQNRKGTLIGNVLFDRYFEGTRWIKNPLTRAEQKKLGLYEALFKKYSHRYGFQWHLIAALAYQESGLNPKRKSPAGAVGIMQVRPDTARDKNVGIGDVHDLENNIHAGVKYLAFLRDRYFTARSIAPESSVHFSLAAYNAGPAKVRQMRARTTKMRLDSNRWFGNVERAALSMVGRETPRYVANVYKYYLAYTLLGSIDEKKAAELKSKTQ